LTSCLGYWWKDACCLDSAVRPRFLHHDSGDDEEEVWRRAAVPASTVAKFELFDL
jgi:hypothetical protein